MPEIQTIYLIHHSHTDIGYTVDQPILWDLATRFIDEALKLADRYADHEGDGAFRWTVETTATLQAWLRYASSRDIARLQALERAGRIEITGMLAHLTPLVDTDQLIESLQFVRTLREDYGFTVRHAMHCDVNGVNWPFVDVLLDCGIEGFTMAINSHFGGPMAPRPYPFLWQGPSGRSLPVFNGWPYDKGWREGIGRNAEEFEAVRWPRLQAYLQEIDYPLPILLLQSYHPYGDNGSAFDFTPFIEAWNAQGKQPRLVMATPRIWWEAVKPYLSELRTFRGDWTDFWNFGCASSAREVAINRRSREMLRHADALFAALGGAGRWARQSFARHRDAAYWNLHLWDEHTWGADISIRQPESEDTHSQWYHKASYAYTARSLSRLLRRDALADFAQLVERKQPEDLLVFNPLPWRRTLSGPVPAFTLNPRGVASDTTAGRHHQDRDAVLNEVKEVAGQWALPPTTVEGCGYTVVPRCSLVKLETWLSEEATVENHRYRLTFDRERGGIVSLYDKRLEHEWVDTNAPYRLNQYLHEQVADSTHDWPRRLLFDQHWDAPLAEIPPGWRPGWRARRSAPSRLLAHQVRRTPLGITVVQTIAAPGCAGPLTQEVSLPADGDYLECLSRWQLGLSDHPEATYLVFPFELPGATARIDVGAQAIIPEVDQLPGVCRDYFTVQNWVDFSNDQQGVTITMPENPMVQLGDFHFGHYQRQFVLGRPYLIGWVTNNYWETNFRAHQPGQVMARYRLYPHAGPFNETAAHRVGREAAQATPLIQHLGELASSTVLPSQGALLSLPEGPVQTLHLEFDPAGQVSEHGWCLSVRLLNASDAPQTAVIGSGWLELTGATRCDLLGRPQAALELHNGRVSCELEARRAAVIKLQVRYRL
ncbi:MAG: hypothetical protein KGZ35_02315 [Truepera sp.]|nr:hypothetical protein [Truepera sp.]